MKTTSSSAAWQTVERIRDRNGTNLNRKNFISWFARIYFLMKTRVEADGNTDEEEWASGEKEAGATSRHSVFSRSELFVYGFPEVYIGVRTV
jgi:hypothetical protein